MFSTIPTPNMTPQNSAKWLLSLLGEGLEEYQPFARYGKGLLFTALLESQGLQTKPFLDRGMDAGILVDLEDDFLSTDVGLDKIALLKVSLYEYAMVYGQYATVRAMHTFDAYI